MYVNNKNHTILPVATPVLTASPENTNYLSTIASIDNANAWIYSNHIQLAGRKNFSKTNHSIFFAFGTEFLGQTYLACPWINTCTIDIDIINTSNIIAWICECIDKRYYVSMDVNQRYFRCFNQYLITDFIHTIFIFGYDQKNRIFYVSDFFKNGKYCQEQITYEEFELGFQNRKVLREQENFDKEEKVVLFKVRDKQLNIIEHTYELDLKRIRNTLEEYLGTTNHGSISYSRDKFLYGVELYNELKIQVDNVLLNRIPLKEKSFHILCDHKSLMKNRIEYINGIHSFSSYIFLHSSATEVQKMAEITKGLVIKYNITRQKTLLEKILYYLEEIQCIEEMYLPILVAEIDTITNTE